MVSPVRVSIEMEPPSFQRIAETAHGDPGKVHLLVNHTALHDTAGKPSQNPWPWGRTTVRVPTNEVILDEDHFCVICLDILNGRPPRGRV